MPKAIKAETAEMPAFRRFECPGQRDGVVLLWRPDSTRQHRVTFRYGFYATGDPDQLACLDYLVERGQVVEVPLEQTVPTQPVKPGAPPRIPPNFDKD